MPTINRSDANSMAQVAAAQAAARQAEADSGPLTNGQDVRNRLDLCQQMVKMARDAGIPPQLLFMTMGVETGFHQNSGGDRDSVGLFQQRPSCGWGSSAECYDPIHAAQTFIQHAAAYKGQFGDSPEQLGAWCQKVQGSAFPDRYQGLYSEAQRCVASVDAGTAPGGKDVSPDSAGGVGGGDDLSMTDGVSSGGSSPALCSTDTYVGNQANGTAGVATSADTTNPSTSDAIFAALMSQLGAQDESGIEDTLKKMFPTLSPAQIKSLAVALTANSGLVKALQNNPKLVSYLQSNPTAVNALASKNPKDLLKVLAAAGVPDAFQAQGAAPVVIVPKVDQSTLAPDPALAADVAATRALSKQIQG